MTAPGLRAECHLATELGWAEQHNRCTVQDCPCTCHAARPAFIGQAHGSPEAPAPVGPHRCDHCGRITTDWLLQERVDDRGPLNLIWCRDSVACDAARRAGARPSRIRLIHRGHP